jgi:hypothetical protein
VKFGEVGTQDGWRVAGRIAGDKDGAQCVWGAGLDYVNCFGHFVEFIGTDVRAVGEPEINLYLVTGQRLLH